MNVDEVQIGLAFSNLISNALASAPSGIVLEVSLSYQDIHSSRAGIDRPHAICGRQPGGAQLDLPEVGRRKP